MATSLTVAMSRKTISYETLHDLLNGPDRMYCFTSGNFPTLLSLFVTSRISASVTTRMQKIRAQIIKRAKLAIFIVDTLEMKDKVTEIASLAFKILPLEETEPAELANTVLTLVIEARTKMFTDSIINEGSPLL